MDRYRKYPDLGDLGELCGLLEDLDQLVLDYENAQDALDSGAEDPSFPTQKASKDLMRQLMGSVDRVADIMQDEQIDFLLDHLYLLAKNHYDHLYGEISSILSIMRDLTPLSDEQEENMEVVWCIMGMQIHGIPAPMDFLSSLPVEAIVRNARQHQIKVLQPNDVLAVLQLVHAYDTCGVPIDAHLNFLN